LASLNSSSANYGTTGAFVPGQVVVSQGANSALKFQSGADSSSFIQIDTLNIQTGSSGIEAGSDKQMMDVGSVIADSGVGKLGALGLNDSIDTWQTAFKNAAAAVDTAIEYVSSKRATYGSQMNRLSFVTTNLTAQSTNLQNSRSAIIDTDFASETAKLTKGQIMSEQVLGKYLDEFAVIGLLILIIVLELGTFILNKMNRKIPKFLTDLKAKLMWSAVLRPIHQGYFR
jgi:flagellin